MRTILGLAAVAALIAFSSAHAFEPDNPECIAPANPGGGWDFTCRQTGKVLYELKEVPGPVQVVNKAGGGGAVAYAEVVAKRNDENNLIVAASTTTTTHLAQAQYVGPSGPDLTAFVPKSGIQWMSAQEIEAVLCKSLACYMALSS